MRATPQLVPVSEWTTARLHLDDADRVAVVGLLGAVVQSVTPTARAGEFDVVLGSVAGRIALPSGVVLDVASRRISTADLLHLLRVTGRFPSLHHAGATPGGAGAGVVDVLALSLAREVDGLVAAGLAKEYVTRRLDRPPYGGVLDVREHLGRRMARADQLVTRVRRLTTDTPRHQQLAAALAALHRSGLREVAERAVLRSTAAMGPVSPTSLSASALRALVGTHRLGRYDAALELAITVAQAQELDLGGAGLRSSSLLFALPQVWEDAVALWACGQHPGRRVVQQHPFAVTDGREITARADVVVLDDDGRVERLLDAKYKRLGSTPSAADVYQMVTYCHRLGLRRASLVHPASDGPLVTRVVSIGDVDVETIQLPATAVTPAGADGVAPAAPAPSRSL
ncbi:5-methylcytosine restriction system specificity protein McrC [Quadrisphaera setariae]|uniref:5-methylcytosine-specific restriction enzyme subunit McrC n=1 Tax=Quadrisphaera setariae TaxID=2593304 RepID=A0A5C8ZC81_9ACTN|nr:hypothetical protein [Quadrisphaera setariae]TXR55492.1 hypothetical protein FMM08_14360 [Quadrisphaera setariae]